MINIEALRSQSMASPFEDGTEMMFFQWPTGWLIANDGVSITLTCASPQASWEYGSVGQDVRQILQGCPAADEVFGFADGPDGLPVCTMPVLEAANKFAKVTLDGLPVAGLRAVQTSDEVNTPSPTYVRRIHYLGEVSVARKHGRYVHDLGHFMRAIAIEKQDLEAFGALVEDAGLVYQADPAWSGKKYMDALAQGFDDFTETRPWTIVDPQQRANQQYLLGSCLTWIQSYCSEFVKRAQQVLIDRDMGRPSGAYGGYRVPWEQARLPAHYAQIAERFKWQPPAPVAA
jgi:hypothetical protein